MTNYFDGDGGGGKIKLLEAQIDAVRLLIENNKNEFTIKA